MATWQQWITVSDGPYQGKPVVEWAGMNQEGPKTSIQDRAGNVVVSIPGGKGFSGQEYSLGGAGVIAHLPNARGEYATGTDRHLYRTVINEQGIATSWRKVKGPGQLLGEAWSEHSHGGWSEILGEGTEHQLVYAYVTLDQFRKHSVPEWASLGMPGVAGGPMGMKGRPACVRDAAGVLHVLVRGQDNHLWHLHGKGDNNGSKHKFGTWTNLGGGLSQVPVAIGSGNKVEVFVIGEKLEPYVKTWNGRTWSEFTPLGRIKVSGLPAAISRNDNDTTFLFVRGVDNKLWYRRRVGTTWQRWQSVGDGLTGDPAVWEGYRPRGGAVVTCMCLRENGALWARELTLTKREYEGKTKPPPPPAPPQTYTHYIVRSGDTAGAISKAYGISLAELKRLNNLANVNRIQAGQTLRVPAKKGGLRKS